MEKIIRVGDYEIPLKSTAASLFSYKANFKRDALKDLFALAAPLSKVAGDGAQNEQALMQSIAENGLDLDMFYRFLWVFARSADKSIPLIEDWLEGFDMAPFDFMAETLPVVAELLVSTVEGTTKSKNHPAAARAK